MASLRPQRKGDQMTTAASPAKALSDSLPPASPAGHPDTHNRMANAIRALAMDAVEAAKSGHPGMPMGMADVATVLFTRYLKFDPTDPHWPDRDRFVLSAGHGSMLLYALLYLTGYSGMSLDDIRHFRQLGSPAAGHPEYGHAPGIETTTGPLGQGLGNAVGMALAERILNARFSDSLVDHRTYVIASDGDLMEGISHESCSLAGHLKLNRLIVLYDDNHISIDGPTELADSTNTLKRFEAYGWAVSRIDGQDAEAVDQALAKAQTSGKPVFIACRTTIGYGAPKRAGTAKAHGEALGAEEVAGARTALGWPYPPFEIPSDLLAEWRSAGSRSKPERQAWESRLSANPLKDQFQAMLSGEIPASLAPALAALKAKFSAEKPSIATRKASEMVLEVVNANLPSTIGGSADLTGSVFTKTKNDPEISPGVYSGRFIHYGIREHGMAAAMNGMALHKGLIPYSGTFLVFSDYCRPSIRLAALMGQRVIHVMTHDSIGLGEDGPTHQPVEHLASLRAMPNLRVFRPCDAVETVECWQLALQAAHTPSVLALTRQNVPQLRNAGEAANRCAAGAYELVAADGEAQVSLFASGSEVSLAVEAQKVLAGRGIPTRVVSVPCFELLFEASEAARRAVIGDAPVKVGIEAAVRQGWDAIIGTDGAFVGMTSFGASAPAKDLYRHFGITVDAIVAAATR